jgi:plastocyanin
MASVTLSWGAPPATDNVTAFQIYGANGTGVAFGSCTLLATVSGLTWTDTGLPNNQARTYYIVAQNAAGSSSPEGPVNVTTSAPSSLYVQTPFPWKVAVRAKTAAALPANTYANGTSGVGATLTGTTNGAMAAVDGVTLAANDRLIVDQEATGSHNGFYAVTQLGDATHPYILTRTADADEPGELVNAAAKVSEGSTFADQEWQCTTNAPITVGTTALVFKPASTKLVAGTNVTITDNGDGTFTVASSGGGGGGGLWSALLSATPTASSTGLSNLLGTGASVTDTSAGVLVAGTSGMGAYTTSIPSTPYSITALLATSKAAGVTGLGWTDGTKIHFVYVQNTGIRTVQANTNITTFSTTSATSGSGFSAKLVWLKIRDDGTTVFFMNSSDGVNFDTIFSVAKSAGFLGATGYNHIFVGSPGGTGAEDVTVMSWTQGT